MLVYFFSKALPILILPLGISLLFLIIFKNKKWNIFIVFFLLLFFSNQIVSQLCWQIIEKDQKSKTINSLNKSEYVVVLGGGIVEAGERPLSLDWIDPDKFEAGLEILSNNKAQNIIFTGSSNPFYKNRYLNEGELLRRSAIKRGFDNEKIIITNEVYRTLDEANEVKSILNLKRTKNNKIILVADAFHMNRAKYIFEHNGIEVEPFPVNFKTRRNISILLLNPLSYLPSAKYLNESTIVLRELIGNILYKLFL